MRFMEVDRLNLSEVSFSNRISYSHSSGFHFCIGSRLVANFINGMGFGFGINIAIIPYFSQQLNAVVDTDRNYLALITLLNSDAEIKGV